MTSGSLWLLEKLRIVPRVLFGEKIGLTVDKDMPLKGVIKDHKQDGR